MSADDPGLPSTLPGATVSVPPDSFSDVDSDIGEWIRDLAPDGLPIPSPSSALAPGQRIGQHFEVRARLGEGGMGVVYLARDDRLDREVAIKLVGRRSDRATARLAREAQAMAQLSHPNVLVVHEVGEHAGSVYIAMEFVDGPTLRAWQEQRTRTWQALLEVYLQAARGLAAAHAAGLVHRDFKPDNVLVGRDGRVRVADFGLARAHHDGNSSSEISAESSASRPRRPDLAVLTRTDAVLGTPAYMAPEQHGRASVTPSVDQFAFGVALHEALWGRRPFGELPNWLASEGDRVALVDPRGTPRWLRRLVRRLTAIEPHERLPAMDDVAAAIERGLRATRRRPLVAGGVAVLGLTAAIGIGVGLGSRPDPCADAERTVAATWSQELRARVDRAFADDGAAAHEGWLRLRDGIDGWFDGWAAARRSACEATRVHGSRSEALLDRGVACFDARLERARATVQFLADDPEARQRVIDVLAGMPGYTECTQADYLLASVTVPDDATTRDRVAVLDAEIAAATLELEVGRVDPAESRLADVERVAASIDWPPLGARLARERARIDIQRGELAAATQRLRTAYFAARAFGDDEDAASLALLLAFVAGAMNDRRTEAELWLDHAAADLARGAAPASSAVAIAVTRAQVLQRAGENEAAVEVLQVALHDHLASTAPARATAVQTELAAALDASGRHAEARRAYDELIERLVAVYGPDSPRLEHLYNNRGLCEYLLQDLDAAALDLRRAIAIAARDDPQAFESAPPRLNLGLTLAAAARLDEAMVALDEARSIYAARPDALADVALAMNAMGWVEQNRGNASAALALHTEALAKQRRVLPDDHPELAVTYAYLGEAELALGVVDGAIEHLERAAALSSATSHDVAQELPTHLAGLAAAYLAAGRLDDAQARAREVQRLADERGVAARDRGRARFVLAQVAEARARPLDALREARLADAAYRELGSPQTPRTAAEAAAVRGWLDAHDAPH